MSILQQILDHERNNLEIEDSNSIREHVLEKLKTVSGIFGKGPLTRVDSTLYDFFCRNSHNVRDGKFEHFRFDDFD